MFLLSASIATKNIAAFTPKTFSLTRNYHRSIIALNAEKKQKQQQQQKKQKQQQGGKCGSLMNEKGFPFLASLVYTKLH